MEKKFYYILGVISLIGLMIISGCVQEKTLMALEPYVEFEATVVSLSLDDKSLGELVLDESKSYVEGEELYKAPQDSVIVKIDRIIETGGSSNFDWSSLGIGEGKEASLDFKYTVRPTKIITVVGETTQNGDTVSHQMVPTTITFENDYFVFKENGNSETETILPGLQEGTKFKTKLWKTSDVKVEKYEIIS